MFSAQYTDWGEVSRNPVASVVEMLNDALYAAPATELAVLHSISPSASTFVYCLNYSVTALGPARPGLADTAGRGVVHGDDLGLVFGAAINDGIEPFISSGYTRQDRSVTEIIMTYWSNFIWTGSVSFCVQFRPTSSFSNLAAAAIIFAGFRLERSSALLSVYCVGLYMYL